MEYQYHSQFGSIYYAWDGHQCAYIKLETPPVYCIEHDNPVSAWLDVYFRRQHAPTPPMLPAKTAFQQQLRSYLLQLGLGKRETYAQCAQALHTAPRALGQALAANPFALLVPCHRIVAQHSLGGFAYGSTWKENLLHFEQET